MPQIKPTDDLREYLEQKSRHATLQENISEKISETETKSRSLESLITTNSELDTITREVPERLKSLTKLVNAEESAVSELVNTRQTSLKLPRERESSSQSTLALLKGDQLYIAGEFDGTQDKFDGPHVSTKKTLGGFRVLPDSGQGITVKNSGTDSFISSTRREGQIVTLAVWPDSFGAFAELKPKLMDSGLRYQIWIQSSGSDLIVSIGSSTSRAQ